MFRTNLLRYVLTLMIAASACSATSAQHYMQAPSFMASGGGGYSPGIRLPQSQYQAPSVDYYVGKAQPLWDDQQPVEKFITAVAQRSWIRFEYLHWDLDGANGGNLGAPVTGTTTPTFSVNDIETPTTQRGQAFIPQSDLLSLNDVSGVRGTLGVALNGGSLELNVFGTEQGESLISFNNLQARRNLGTPPDLRLGTTARPNVITPLLSDGVVSNAAGVNALVYDESFSADLQGQMWGSEVMLLSETYLPDYGLHWQWLGGFRYVNYDESLGLRGVFTDGGQLPPRVTNIGGSAINNIYGPEIGGRWSLTAPRLTLSATPRIAFALNDHTSSVHSSGLAAGDLTVNRIVAENIDFTPVVQVSLMGEAHLTPHLSIYGGYDLMWIGQMSRVDTNIRYNSMPGVAGGSVASIEQQVDLKSYFTRGLSAGLVLRY